MESIRNFVIAATVAARQFWRQRTRTERLAIQVVVLLIAIILISQCSAGAAGTE